MLLLLILLVLVLLVLLVLVFLLLVLLLFSSFFLLLVLIFILVLLVVLLAPPHLTIADDDVVVMLLAGTLHLPSLLVHVIKRRHQSNIQHGQRRQRNDQHEHGIQHITVYDEVQPVVHERCVSGACDPISAVLETALRKLRCIVQHSQDENRYQLASGIRYCA